jgi:phosphoribosylformylglycinamidine synthase II
MSSSSSSTLGSNLDDLLKHYRLSRDEFDLMTTHLNGREANNIEWALYSALWSEHCSYKSSKIYLKKLFTKHPRVVQGPGENAGVIDLGRGERVAFKMESHNHPSFIEPTQGAATGVGGILRDIFTMGARPFASMDYLCFGDVNDKLTPKLLNGVVRGIGGYGNSVGVATVSGQTTFNSRYNGNILVNAFSIGLFRPGEEIFYGKASGVGNLIVYVGARTGRDGIHGAAMASESFDSDIEKKKPNVQIGDPFFEKLLIEACLEVMKHKLVVGIQDMGAAGLTSSTFEMAARANSGLRMDLKKVPLRESNITPEEILLSESQERMVLVIEPKNLGEVEKIFSKWDLSCCVIGEITSGKNVELMWGEETLANVDHKPLVDGAPVYERPYVLPDPPIRTEMRNDVGSNELAFIKFLASPIVGSRNAITSQYDQRVGARTISACEDSVALLILPDSRRVIGMATGCRPSIMNWHPEVGAADAIILPALQMAARGVRALAVTDCLNFGNPEKPKVMGEFVASLKSLNSACEKFDTPIISGNVSLYNETLGESIIPTPSTGLVGLRDTIQGPRAFMSESDLGIYLLSTLSSTSLLAEFNHVLYPEEQTAQGFAEINLDEARALQEALLLISSLEGLSSQVISKGGLAMALFKLCEKGIGAEIDFFENGKTIPEFLFAERFYSAVLAVKKTQINHFEKMTSENPKLRCVRIGKSSQSGSLSINHYFNIKIESLNTAYLKGVGGFFENLA